MTTLGSVSDSVLRLSVFGAVLLAMVALEALMPRRARVRSRTPRWTTNLSIVGLGSLMVRALAVLSEWVAVPLIAITAALVAAKYQIGILHWLPLPTWVQIAVTVVVLDFAVWLQHLLSHRFGALWAFHQVHHADPELDATSALRFHPIEIGLSMIYKVVWVFLLGAPAAGVLVFEIILNASAMFNHANWALPVRADRWLRAVIVTPDMHRVHHSVHQAEHNANFGFCLSIWDRMFATYVAQPREGHAGMTIGLSQYPTEGPTQLGWSLALPFRLASSKSTSDLADSPPSIKRRSV